VERAFAETVAQLGRVDACFANAGTYGHPSRFTALETAEWQRVMRINLDGAFFTLRAAARHMVGRGGGGSLVEPPSRRLKGPHAMRITAPPRARWSR
jgi:NAD(P)-dependent dehydrogenase (short-subunit alcohol dehydrogenase family)